MGLLATVSPVEVEGVEGGSNFYLRFEVVEDATVEGLEVQLEAGDVYWELAEDNEEDPELDPEEDPATKWHCESRSGEFSWSGNKQDLAVLLGSEGVRDPEKWSWTGPVNKEPQKKFVSLFFVGGNAD